MVNALTPGTTYYVRACSTAGSEACSAEQTVTTGAASPVYTPTPPTAVDFAWAAGGGTTRTVGADCNHPSTGLQALLDASAHGDRVELPENTLNCAGNYVYTKTGGSSVGVLLTTTATNRPPAGSRDDGSARWGRSKIYKSWLDYGFCSGAECDGLTGKVALATYGPGSIIYRTFTSGWLVRKAALTSTSVAITGASSATPIVITTAAPHGFSNGDAVCINGVLGNVAANGCFRAASVTSTTLALTLRDGSTNQAGSGTYTSGGTLRGLEWQAITPAVTNAGRLFGACATPGSWGHDTTASIFTQGMYRCSTGNFWVRIMTDDSRGQDANGLAQNAALNIAPDSHRLRVRGIEFADLPIPAEPEYEYGPRRGARGAALGGVLVGGKGSHRIDLDQVTAPSDISTWRTNTLIEGETQHLRVANSSFTCGGYHLAYIAEVEMPCTAVAPSKSVGPLAITNNKFKVGGWAYFAFESSGIAPHGGITFARNNVEGVLEYAHGTSYYAFGSSTKTFKTRQFAEIKSGREKAFTGNTFDGLAFSAGPVTTAFALGVAAPVSPFASIATNGTLTTNSIDTKPVLSVEDRIMMIADSGASQIVRVATTSPLVVKNLDGTTYNGGAASGTICSIDVPANFSDVQVVGNTITRTAGPFVLWGNDYAGSQSCVPPPSARVRIAHNLSQSLAIGQTNGWCGVSPTNCVVASAWTQGGVNYLDVSHNTMQESDPSTSTQHTAFLQDALAQNKGVGLRVTDNAMGSSNLGVTGLSNVGSASLDVRWPGGWTFSGNALVRAGGTIAAHPATTTFPPAATIGYSSAANFSLRAASAYRGQDSTDGMPIGHDPQVLDNTQGRVSDIRHTASAGSLLVRWKYAGGAACSVDATNDNWATYTRSPLAATAARSQSVTMTLPAGSWLYQVLCPGTVDPVATGTATVP
jgi:hypothetical protein